MRKTDKKNKSNYIFLNKLYRFSIVILIFVIAIICSNFFLVKGEKKCEQVKVIKKEIINENVVFFGDSITDYYDLDKYFPNLKKVNSGIRGNRTWHLKNDMYNRVYRYNPSKVVLLIGINNFLLENDSVENVTKDIQFILDEIHKNLPYSKIIVQSIYPINTDWCDKYKKDYSYCNDTTKKIVDANTTIKDYCEKNKFKYIDLFDTLSDDNLMFKKEYTDDGLHPNENGYIKITEVLKKYL